MNRRDVCEPIAIALGSNQGDRAALLARAREELAARVAVLARISRIYETEPVGPVGQSRYLNQVVALENGIEVERLLETLLAIEGDLGRTRAIRWGPRSIDLDLLLYGQRTCDSERLTLPHPRLHERAFVLAPLADVLPDWTHPRFGLTVAEMLARVGRRGIWLWEGDSEDHGSRN